MHLVADHVLELLVVNGAKEGVGLLGLARKTRREEVLAGVVETVFDKSPANVLNLVATKCLQRIHGSWLL